MTGFVSAGTFSAIPDTSMFQSPIYQWYAGLIDASDGTSPIDYPEGLAGLNDATAVGSPTFRESDLSKPAVEYDPNDGDNDGHDWTPDSDLPTGDSQFSIFGLVQVPSDNTAMLTTWGNDSTDESAFLRTNGDGTVQGGHWANNVKTSGTITTGTLQTIGVSYDQSQTQVGINGSFDNSISQSGANVQNQNHSLGYRGIRNDQYFDGYIVEAIVCDVGESDTVFTNYHNDRI